MRAGFALRLRDKDGRSEATLKGLRSARDDAADRREITEPLSAGTAKALGRVTGPVGARVHDVAGTRPLRTLFDAIEGDITLLADVPEFMPVGRDTPARFRYTGPILWDADMRLPAWFSKLRSDRPTVYFTMGSTGDSKFFEEAVRVFGGTDYQVLITTGGLAEVPGAPGNVFITKYAPGEALVARSDVVVSHGGNGTVYQALSRGVPIIGLPTIFDQEINMQRVTALGAGLRMWRSLYDARALKDAVDRILADASHRDRCRRLARQIAHYDGPRRAAVHIDHLLGSGRLDTLAQPSDVTRLIKLLPQPKAA